MVYDIFYKRLLESKIGNGFINLPVYTNTQISQFSTNPMKCPWNSDNVISIYRTCIAWQLTDTSLLLSLISSSACMNIFFSIPTMGERNKQSLRNWWLNNKISNHALFNGHARKNNNKKWWFKPWLVYLGCGSKRTPTVISFEQKRVQ